jgi:hypothetical protein
MPALFAYLIAVGLLLGGGYGALTWLAAPEPVKIVAKAKPTPRPHFAEAKRETASEPSGHQPQKASPETTSPETTSPETTNPKTVGQTNQVAAGSNQPPVAPPVDGNAASKEQKETASTEQGARAEASVPAQTQVSTPAQAQQTQQNPAVSAEVSPAEIRPPTNHAQPAEAASTGRQTTAASTVPAAAAKTVKPKRPHQRLASRAEKPALALMTLRTIEFPDGHRVTQLLPYRDDDRD